jgi:hypothetical protein
MLYKTFERIVVLIILDTGLGIYQIVILVIIGTGIGL